jgi:hypothetical protein
MSRAESLISQGCVTLADVEVTGQHVRVLLFGAMVDTDEETNEVLEEIARALVPNLGTCWDVNHLDIVNVELSFERVRP